MAVTAEQLTELFEQARAAARLAYAPYSGFWVGAALLFEDGAVVTGCNVENASYGLTMCAERSALFCAVSGRGAGVRVAAIAVTNLNTAASPPCGACRQVLSEFVTEDAVVLFEGEAGSTVRVPFHELFPYTFLLEGKSGVPA